MGFKQFISKAVPQGYEVIIGKHAVMAKRYPQVGEHSHSDKGTAGGQSFVMETNPDVIVFYNPKTGWFARGTWNCLVCALRQDKPSIMCGEMQQPLTQQDLFRYDYGGCVFVDCYEILGKTQPANQMRMSSLYERISEEKDKGAVFSLTSAGFRRLVAPDFDRPPD